MNCRACGGPVSGDWEFCEYCGHSIRGKERPVQSRPPTTSGISTIVVIVVVVIVVVPIVFSAVLYYMVLEFSRVEHLQTPHVLLTKSVVTDGVKLAIGPITLDTQWSDIAIVLSEGSDGAQWCPATADLDNGMKITAEYGEESLGPLTVYCNVTDMAGNGYINYGDYFTLTTGGGLFSPVNTYTCTLIYEPTDGHIGSISFTG